MAVNEFEKNVQEKMDAFSLHPSDAVWANVEKEINDRKRKRRILFLIVFSCLGICLAGYCIYEFMGATKTAAPITKAGNKIDPGPTDSINKIHIANQTGSTSKDVATNKETPNANNVKTNVKTIGRNTVNQKTAGKSFATNKPDKYSTKDADVAAGIVANTNKVSKASRQKETDGMIPQSKDRTNSTTTTTRKDNNNTVSLTVSDSATPADKNQDNVTKKLGANENEVISDSSRSAAPKESLQTQTAQESNPVRKKAQISTSVVNDKQIVDKKSSESRASLQPRNRVVLGLHFSLGGSRFGKQLIAGGDGAKSTYSQFGNIGYPGTPGAYTITLQSKSKLALAFELGVRAEKQVTRRINVSVGLDYALMTDRIQTGTKRVTSAPSVTSLNISSYYTASQQMGYTDRIHLISIPIELDWRVTGNAHHYLSLNGGFALTTLLTTNALVYDTAAGGIYYQSKRLFSTIGLSFRPGISYHTHIGGHDLNVGPQFSIGLNDFIKSDVDERRYLIYGGVNMNLLFGKRKAK